MPFDPRVQVKPVECDPHLADANDDQPRANVAVEHSTPDTAVGRSIAIADHTRSYYDGHGALTVISKIKSRQRCERANGDAHVLFRIKKMDERNYGASRIRFARTW